jgi:ABC-type lipoprotein release transport system permease subunit
VGGALLGVGASALVNVAGVKVPLAVQLFTMSNTLRLQLVTGNIVFAVVLITLVTALAALYPALRAAKLQPITAMHHVG